MDHSLRTAAAAASAAEQEDTRAGSLACAGLRAQQHLDGAALIHGRIGFRHLGERQFEVKDASRFDRGVQDQRQQRIRVIAHGRDASRHAHIRAKTGFGSAVLPRRTERRRSRPDRQAAHMRIAWSIDSAVPTHSSTASAPIPPSRPRTSSMPSSPREATISVAPKSRASACRSACRDMAIMRSAPS